MVVFLSLLLSPEKTLVPRMMRFSFGKSTYDISSSPTIETHALHQAEAAIANDHFRQLRQIADLEHGRRVEATLARFVYPYKQSLEGGKSDEGKGLVIGETLRTNRQRLQQRTVVDLKQGLVAFSHRESRNRNSCRFRPTGAREGRKERNGRWSENRNLSRRDAEGTLEL